MKIIALDIETTGLNVLCDQILQIGAVMFDSDDMDTPVDALPCFETLVQHDRYEGQPFALAMNTEILYLLAGGEGVLKGEALLKFRNFILAHQEQDVCPYPLGFNVASFDIAMLRNHGMPVEEVIHYRAFELGSMFATKGGPGNSKVLIGKHLDRGVAHTALQDARDAVELYRVWWKRQ